MECPYCKKEMEAGYVNAGGVIVWSKKAKIRREMEQWLDRDAGDVIISDSVATYNVQPVKQKAMLCRECRIVIALPDLKNEPTNWLMHLKSSIKKLKSK